MKTTLFLILITAALVIHIMAQDNDTSTKPEDSTHRPQPKQHNRYTIAQATSDRAQLNTIAFDGLAVNGG